MRLYSVFVLFLLISCGLAFNNEFSLPKLINQVKNGVCLVEVKNGNKIIATGTGWLLNNQYTVITAAHVAKVKGSFTVVFDDNKAYDVKDVLYSKLANSPDVGVLKLDKKELDSYHRPFFTLSNKEPELGEDANFIGYPLDFTNPSQQTFRTGHISYIGDDPDYTPYKALIIQATSVWGFSGSPVFDNNGKVIGLLNLLQPVPTMLATVPLGDFCKCVTLDAIRADLNIFLKHAGDGKVSV